ncbi:MAG: hypothetical protein KF691_02370 [Phycisphaeraceae bacterium]|nr:hypothetical protein [Phycisphaeraceae bacterium]
MPEQPPREKPAKRQSFAQRSAATLASSDASLKGKIPDDVLDLYEVHQWKHAAAILKTDFPTEFSDLMSVLRDFRIHKRQVMVGGGGKTDIAASLDAGLYKRGWSKKRWDTKIVVDVEESKSPTHEVDNFKNRVAVEVEWSNKDPFFDRDLNNFRLLFDLRVISVGVIITKSDNLAAVFDDLGIWSKYGTTTTWMHKLIPRIEGGGGGGCPLLVFGLTRKIFVED